MSRKLDARGAALIDAGYALKARALHYAEALIDDGYALDELIAYLAAAKAARDCADLDAYQAALAAYQAARSASSSSRAAWWVARAAYHAALAPYQAGRAAGFTYADLEAALDAGRAAAHHYALGRLARLDSRPDRLTYADLEAALKAGRAAALSYALEADLEAARYALEAAEALIDAARAYADLAAAPRAGAYYRKADLEGIAKERYERAKVALLDQGRR